MLLSLFSHILLAADIAPYPNNTYPYSYDDPIPFYSYPSSSIDFLPILLIMAGLIVLLLIIAVLLVIVFINQMSIKKQIRQILAGFQPIVQQPAARPMPTAPAVTAPPTYAAPQAQPPQQP